jgi:hypothetical protein
MTTPPSRLQRVACFLIIAVLAGCAPAIRHGGGVVASKPESSALSPERASGSVIIVLPSRAIVESEVRAASADHRPQQLVLDIDRTNAETEALGRNAQASRLFDKVSIARDDQPDTAEIGDNDYRIWAQQGGEGFVWHVGNAAGKTTELAFDRPDDFPQAALSAVRHLGGTIQPGIGAPMIHVGNNRVFQKPVSSNEEDIVIEIHDDIPKKYRRIILHHVMASKVFKKYQPIIDARAKLYWPDDYSIGFNFIGKKLIYPAIGCRVYCE